jgi:hypothetical protein
MCKGGVWSVSIVISLWSSCPNGARRGTLETDSECSALQFAGVPLRKLREVTVTNPLIFAKPYSSRFGERLRQQPHPHAQQDTSNPDILELLQGFELFKIRRIFPSIGLNIIRVGMHVTNKGVIDPNNGGSLPDLRPT